MKYYFMAFKNYAKCDGRATRKEYWWFILFHYIVISYLSRLDGAFGFYSEKIPLDYGYMTLVYVLASVCPAICLQIRRLHDVGKSGVWWWAGIVPILSLYVLCLTCEASEPSINIYGTPANYVPNTVGDEEKQTDSLNQIKFCRKCGYKLVNGSAFCSQCGTEIIYN